ncbi:hypothetical protein [Streptomonospora salina]|uniref:hypothetical protein n=1 Tax=Streptomonospora salina TaxID=104205 RepID=UPI0028A7D2D9|nr:hypothetical protein [Streptomonospora salina]
MSRHESRQRLALEYGATDVLTERGDEGGQGQGASSGLGAHSLSRPVGTQEVITQAIPCTRPGGHVGFVGVSHGVSPDGEELLTGPHRSAGSCLDLSIESGSERSPSATRLWTSAALSRPSRGPDRPPDAPHFRGPAARRRRGPSRRRRPHHRRGFRTDRCGRGAGRSCRLDYQESLLTGVRGDLNLFQPDNPGLLRTRLPLSRSPL